MTTAKTRQRQVTDPLLMAVDVHRARRASTHAGRALVSWARSDARPITEFGYKTVSQAVRAIEAELTVRHAAQAAKVIERIVTP